ncbi:hypothetical protein MOXK02_05560 [Moraxella sp. K02]
MNNNIGIACKITTGKLDANQAIQNGQYPFYTCAEFPDTIDSFAFDDDVVLVAGNNAKGNFHVNRFKGKFNAYQRTYVLTAKKGFDIDFIYYSLKLELKRLKEKSQGSQTKFLTMPILQNIGLKNLSESEQKQISSVLSTLDEKIALNNQINATLEQMAKTLYDYWFVQFDFPDDNGKPYKSSGGEMVYNEILKREIPKGWEVDSLANLSIFIRRGISPIYSENEQGLLVLNQKCIRNQTINFDFARRDVKNRILDTERYLAKYDILINSTGVGTLGRVAFIKRLPEENVIYDSHVTAVRCNSKIIKPLVLSLAMLRNQSLIETAANGSTGQVELSRNFLEELLIIKPNDMIQDKFTVFAAPIFEKVAVNEMENEHLLNLRDWLLPMLMNGQVTVQ